MVFALVMRRPMTSPAGGGSRGRCSQGHSSRAAALARQHLPGWDAQARLRALIMVLPCSQQTCGSAAKAAARCHEGEIQRPRHTRLHTARPEQPRPSDAHERSTSPPSLTCAPVVVACVDSRCHERQGTDNILAASVFRAVLVAGRCREGGNAPPTRHEFAALVTRAVHPRARGSVQRAHWDNLQWFIRGHLRWAVGVWDKFEAVTGRVVYILEQN